MSSQRAFRCLHCRIPASADDLQKPTEPAWEAEEGTPNPLGATWVVHQQAWNFAVYSRHATVVRLLLFSKEIRRPALVLTLEPLKNKSGAVWHCRVPYDACPEAEFYAWQMDGPPPAGGLDYHAFDAEKVLLDPYATSVYFPPDFSRDAARLPGCNMGKAPLGVLNTCVCPGKVEPGGKIRHGSDLVIYEMHVRGFTRHPSSGVSEKHRGTFYGVIDKIPHLQQLGVTAVELMPVFQFDPAEENYWGYMPLNFFAPHHLYSTEPDHCAQRTEFRRMVQALHNAGIEVILDVVYNHTCEGDQRGPVYSFKGIDNSTYYMLTGDPAAPYANFSGTGNTLHTSNRAVRELVVDSLRYWVTEMGVDGFRFDLASVFTRRPDGSINTHDPPIFAQIASDPVLRSVRLIAEPWDAAGAFQLGHTFPGNRWLQWNAHYRDTVRRFVRGDAGMVPDLMTRVYGSSDLFPDSLHAAFRPFQSVNYVTSHDGFTLYDLVAYNQKHNWANGHQNTDGQYDYSWNCGWEGDEGAPASVLTLRRQQARNFLCLLLLSNGTPMLRMGDEFLQTQKGNNNPYNQDNEITWLDWGKLDSERDVFHFARQMIAFRKQHPSLSRSRFWREDIHWYGAQHYVDLGPESRTLAWCLRGNTLGDDDIYVMVNGSAQDVVFGIHEGKPGDWQLIIDTSNSLIRSFEQSVRIDTHSLKVPARSVLVLVRNATT